MEAARAIYRYLVVVLFADVIVQFFLAGSGVFRAKGGVAHDSSAFDPHRTNGTIIQIIALLVLISALAARSGRWKVSLAVFVLSIVQAFLATGGWVGGLHPLGGLAVFVLTGWMAHNAWSKRSAAPTVPASL